MGRKSQLQRALNAGGVKEARLSHGQTLQLMDEIGSTFATHDEFREFLMGLPGKDRAAAYDALRNRLKFRPHPLATYELKTLDYWNAIATHIMGGPEIKTQ